jgi:GNAT superfamily N-acetyltransferase
MPPSNKRPKILTRLWKEEDIPALVECQYAAYSNFPHYRLCDERLFHMQRAAFPEGQFLAEIEGRIVGYCASLIVNLDDSAPWHSYSEITGSGTFGTHDPSGDSLYGAEIAVHPDYRRIGVSSALYSGSSS